MRTAEQIRKHYEVERELATRLRQGSAEDRRKLYSPTYDELFRRVPDHPMLTRKADPSETQRKVGAQLRILRRFLRPDTCFLEIGPGDCSLSFAVAREVRQVYAVDVSEVITASSAQPANFKLIISDGVSISVPSGAVTVAFSNQLMEHLHPDDALAQLRNICAALAPGGVYFCVTPSALSGPHDVSRAFDRVASGFHLKEYTNRELGELFLQVGFSRVRVFLPMRGRSLLLPLWIARAAEWLVRAFPYPLGRELASRLPFRSFLGVNMVGYKDNA